MASRSCSKSWLGRLWRPRAYIFQRDEGGADNWGEVKKLTASDAEDLARFGWSVAVDGDTALVGADLDDSEFFTNAGAVYLFERDEGGMGNWGEVKKLVASDAQLNGDFGRGVGVSGDTAVVVANGAAYFLVRDEGGAGNWGEVEKVTGPIGGNVAISGDTAVAGSPSDDSEGSNAGAAYVFDLLLPKPLPTLCQFECVGGVAELPDAAGTPLEAEGSSGPSTGVVAGVAPAVTAGAVALGGAAWYARRRRG